MIASYPCPTPPRRGAGCGCPRSSSRCYGAIRAVRERYLALERDVAATLAECEPQWGWSEQELKWRFG